jgi:hypothetical protein
MILLEPTAVMAASSIVAHHDQRHGRHFRCLGVRWQFWHPSFARLAPLRRTFPDRHCSGSIAMTSA